MRPIGYPPNEGYRHPLWTYWHYLLEAARWDIAIALSSYDQDGGWDCGYRALAKMFAVYPL